MKFSGLLGVLLVSAGVSAPAQAAIVLDPLAGVGGLASGVLDVTWLWVDDEARFSTQLWLEPGEDAPREIGSFGWGTGIWATSDLALLKDPGHPAILGSASGKTGVNFANQIYNDHVASGAYGGWGWDLQRPLAGAVTASGQQTNYAGFMSGYLYVPRAGLYDFGAFVDDGFTFMLYGLGGESAGFSRGTMAGTTSGRDFVQMSDRLGDGLMLGKGFYALSIDYFNRLEAGVMDLRWLTPGNGDWVSINNDNLFHAVPEPGMLALLGIAGIGLMRRRRMSARPRRAVCPDGVSHPGVR